MRRLAILALLCGCDFQRSTLHPAGPAARTLAALGWPLLLGFLAVSIAMWLLLLWAALRKRGSFEEHAPLDAKASPRWIAIGGFAVPGAAFSIIFVATLAVMNEFPMHDDDQGISEIRVVGHQWWWEVQYLDEGLSRYFVTANEIHIPAGQPVDIELLSADVIHSLWAPRLHGKVDLIPGLHNSIRLQADGPGVYPGACAEFCGVQHALMRFDVVAEDAVSFKAWRERQLATARVPTTDEEKRGQRLFLQGACAVCHTVRGTTALATVGPDLTHFGSRRLIAAALPNNLADLHAWITNAPSLKPGTQMPALTRFSGEELQDLAAYLHSLD